ncbi:MAG TPA: DUF5069 domain-containing protein [Candidatus Acidoferrales bacterium]|nr:DUF5069 domain-containing protein [Candidatus Acidoferrales bacterium]
MDALDLTQRPPRGPRVLLDDVDLIFLARTVDKLRATLPGGNLGAYRIPGHSERLLEALGVSEDELRSAVARAQSDADVARWIRERIDASRFPAINQLFEHGVVRDRLGDAEWLKRYPNAASVSPDTKLLDFLALDDEQMFA